MQPKMKPECPTCRDYKKRIKQIKDDPMGYVALILDYAEHQLDHAEADEIAIAWLDEINQNK